MSLGLLQEDRLTFEDYIRARNEMTESNDYRYAISRHVAFRLWERYGVDQRSFRMTDWEQISYACAARRFPIFHKTQNATYFKVALDGQEIMWLYSRERRCVVTRRADVRHRSFPKTL